MTVKDVLKLNVPNNFGTNYEYDEDSLVIEEFSNTVLSFSDVNYRYGATQFVIIPEDGDKVIKLPFSGFWDEEYFMPFEACQNYCDAAINIYEEAEAAGVEQIFSEVIFEGFTKNGHPVYTQEKIVARNPSEEEINSSKSYNKLVELRKSNGFSYWRFFASDWLALAIDWYGWEYIEKVLKFIDNNEQINDLHHGNYGFTKEGRPIIFDYSGFHDDF